MYIPIEIIAPAEALATAVLFFIAFAMKVPHRHHHRH